jgi:hypothetical protein
MVRVALLCCMVLPMMGFLRKKKRGAMLYRSANSALVAMSQHRFLEYRKNGSSKILQPWFSIFNEAVVGQGKPTVLLPGTNANPAADYFRYISIDALNPKKYYPDMILNRPVPFNNAFLKNNILKFGINVPL